jgi:Circadian oscillating protein COP23
MKTKYLSALLVTGAMALGTSPAIANSPDTPELEFSCQVSNGVPITVAQTVGSETQLPIFHWKEAALAYKTDATPQQLCNDVTAKLKDYSAQGYDLSKISFIGTEQEGIPIICANATSGTSECSKMLLTLDKAEQPAIVADEVVSSILDQSLQNNKVEYKGDRGVQSTSYQVDFWSLLGLNLKFLGK